MNETSSISKEELEQGDKIHEILKQNEGKEPEMTWEQRQAIKTELIGGSQQIVDMHRKAGRKKIAGKLINKIIREEKEKFQIKEEKEESDNRAKQKEYEKVYNKQRNELYILQMEIISLLAQKKRRDATELIVEYIQKNEHIYTTRDDLKAELWVYHDGIYVPQGKSYIMEHCREILKEHFTSQLLTEVLYKIEADTFIDVDEFFKTNYLEEIPLENGILNIFTRKLTPFTPKKIFFSKLPVKYNPKAVCPSITKFFQVVLQQKDDAKVMFELFGFCLLKEYRHEKAFMFIGDGRNGKGKTLSLLKKFLGATNCCSVPLSQIHSSSTSVCELQNRLVNLAGDISNSDLKDTGTIKQVTGRDLLNAKRKFLRDLIFVNYAKLIFACNELPKVYDMSEGFWSRWLLLKFPYKFISQKEYDILKQEERLMIKIRDENIIERISTPGELSGLLNKALDGLDRLNSSHNFSYSKGTNEVKDMWIRQSDSFTAFCFDCLEEDYQGVITKKVLRRKYHVYCRDHRVKGASDKGIKVTLQNLYGVIEGYKSVANNEMQQNVWEGIKFK